MKHGHIEALAVLISALGGCAHAPSVVATPRDAYAAAIVATEHPTAAGISTTLTPIAATTASLVWDAEPATSLVHVVTWTDWTGYDARVGESMPLGREVWVTVVPDLQDRCRAIHASGDALAHRLETMLGLPLDTHKTRFVSLAVAPTDLFRACPDAEITDAACSLDFPVDTTPEHRAWIDALRARSYGTNPYPWTQLGYTYDWGSDSNHVGPSEFVVRTGSTVRVVAVDTTDAYCATR